MLWGLLIMAGVAVLAAAGAWWMMIRMPGRSYRGELPAPDDALVALTDELRRHSSPPRSSPPKSSANSPISFAPWQRIMRAVEESWRTW